MHKSFHGVLQLLLGTKTSGTFMECSKHNAMLILLEKIAVYFADEKS